MHTTAFAARLPVAMGLRPARPAAATRVAPRVPTSRSAVPTRRSCVTAAAASQEVSTTPAPAITISDGALDHLKRLQQEAGSAQLLLRIGVKSGGCSGMSYVMDFEEEANVNGEDAIMEYDNGSFKLVCDPKSLLYLFGMHLDYSTELIGGGFKFLNPNAEDTCGCGKSFGV